jgi:PAP2 superfamily
MTRAAGSRLAASLAVAVVTYGSPVAATSPAEAQRSDRLRYHENVVLLWNDLALDAVRRSTLGPPMVARALAIVHTCMYDAWAAYDDMAVAAPPNATVRQPRHERTVRNKREAVSVAAHRAMVDLFPQQQTLAGELMVRLGFDPLVAADDWTGPAGVGNAACTAVLAFRHADGANQLGDLAEGAYADYTGYFPVNSPSQITDPNRWQPLTFSNGRTPSFLAPHWGLVTPFALPAGDAFRPGPPALYPEPEYVRQAEELLHISATLTDRQKIIAEYWADGPTSELPPGHWNLFAQFVSQRDRHSLDESVRLFFLLNNALFDTSVAVWECKRFYDYVRPVTALRYLFSGQTVEAWGGPFLGTRAIDGKDWLPYQIGTFLTPPFAEYPSGHSGFSAAAAEILKRFTGSDAFGGWVVLGRGSSRVEPGLTPRRRVLLVWPTFSAAADQAGRSRRYGGIHFRSGDIVGRTMGRRVAALVWDKAHALFQGRDHTAPTLTWSASTGGSQ